jgi:hypothetical protein
MIIQLGASNFKLTGYRIWLIFGSYGGPCLHRFGNPYDALMAAKAEDEDYWSVGIQ